VEQGFSALTVERVAERAGVARLTIYYQFGSKRELLEAMLDHIAERGQMMRLHDVFRSSDADRALAEFIGVFCGFWASDQVGLRRLRGWAHLEPAFEAEGRGRDEWRRQGLEQLVSRLQRQHGVPAESETREMIDLLHTLTSFETYDNLSVGGRSSDEIAGLLNRTARRLLGLPETPPSG
jgi:AcrR family transcriptional regulator